MSLLNKVVFFLFLIGFFSPSFAAVESIDSTACSVYFEAEEGDKKEGDKKEGEEEPDCE